MSTAIRRGLTVGLLVSVIPLTAAIARTVTVKQITEAKTAAELVKLGAQKLSAAEFRSKVVGHPMIDVNRSWTWSIDSNGMSSSEATNKSWKIGGPWHLRGSSYCRKSKGKEICSAVYLIGPYLRMKDAGSTKLSKWTALLK